MDSDGPKIACLHVRAHWRHLANTIEPCVCRGDVASCQITLTTYSTRRYWCRLPVSKEISQAKETANSDRLQSRCRTGRMASYPKCEIFGTGREAEEREREGEDRERRREEMVKEGT